mgnify:CR=1 FL=1
MRSLIRAKKVGSEPGLSPPWPPHSASTLTRALAAVNHLSLCFYWVIRFDTLAFVGHLAQAGKGDWRVASRSSPPLSPRQTRAMSLAPSRTIALSFV